MRRAVTDSTNPVAETPELTVAQIMREDVPTVAPDDSIALVARTLVDQRITGVPVVENEKIIGIITEADIISREATVDVPAPGTFFDAIFTFDAGADFDEELRRVLAINARQLMSAPVYSIKSSATMEQVATLMIERQINTIPVVDDELHLVGIVTRGDIVKVIAQLENENA